MTGYNKKCVKSYRLQIIICLIFVILSACTYTKNYKPTFNERKTRVIDSIKAKYGFEKVDFFAKTTIDMNGKRTFLSANFKNGKSLPTNEPEMMGLAKILGSQIKGIMKKPEEYNYYIIMFNATITKDGNKFENYYSYQCRENDLK